MQLSRKCNPKPQGDSLLHLSKQAEMHGREQTPCENRQRCTRLCCRHTARMAQLGCEPRGPAPGDPALHQDMPSACQGRALSHSCDVPHANRLLGKACHLISLLLSSYLQTPLSVK